MLILGLAGGLVLPDGTLVPGSAGVGKDTVAAYLAERYGWTVFAFSDQIYQQVQDAYDLPDQELLRDRESKDAPQECLSLSQCSDLDFIKVATAEIDKRYVLLAPWQEPLSPRQVLQWWGTEYRRAQDPDYWITATHRWLGLQMSFGYPEHRCQYYVNTTCRFENERKWIGDLNGQIWHVRRPTVTAPPAHVSEQLLPVLDGERELYNCGTIATLHKAIDLLMTTSAPVVKALPYRVYEPTPEDIADAQAQAVTD